MYMQIHGKELESHDYGKIIYYGNRLIRSDNYKLNIWTDWDYWVKRITNDPNFCACQVNPYFKDNCTCTNNSSIMEKQLTKEDFLSVLIENWQAQIAGYNNYDKTDIERKIRKAVIKEYEDLISIYKHKFKTSKLQQDE